MHPTTDTETPYNLELRTLDVKIPRVSTAEPPDLSMLNDEQNAAVDAVFDVLGGESGSDHILLKGPAGTGKTFVLQKIIHSILYANPDVRIAMTAPTHKAVGVSRSMSPFLNNQKDYEWEKLDARERANTLVTYRTVHSLLAMIQKQDESTDWKETYVRNPKIKPGEEPIREYDIVIVDEVSMTDYVNQDNGDPTGLLADLLYWGKVVTFIFVGDEAQIVPIETGVKSSIFSQSFRKRHNIALAELTTVMRQALDNPVLAMATSVRESGDYVREDKQTDSGRVLFLPVNIAQNIPKRDKPQAQEWDTELDKVIRRIFGSENFAENSDYAKFLAYNVDKVAYWNSRIRTLLHNSEGEFKVPAKIEIGDKLVLSRPYMEYDDKGEKTVKFPNFTELSVINYHVVVQTLPSINNQGIDFKTYIVKVRVADPNTGEITTDTIRVLHESEDKVFEDFLQTWKGHCMSLGRQNNPDKALVGRAWKAYLDYAKYFCEFGYNFALTVHRSQGSSFMYTFIDENNIRQMKHKPSQMLQFKSIMYVATSRARYCNIMVGKGPEL